MHVIVDRHILALRPGLFYQAQVGRGIARRAKLGRVVRNLQRHARLPADMDRLGHGFQDRLPFTPHMGRVQALVAGHNPAQRDNLTRICEAAGRIDQPGGQAHGPGRHRLGQQRAHAIQLGGGGRPGVEAHDRHPQGPMAGQGTDVNGQTTVLQRIQVLVKGPPGPGDLRLIRDWPPMMAHVSQGTLGHRGRRHATVAHDVGRRSLADGALSAAVDQDRQVGVGVHIHKTGGDEPVANVEGLLPTQGTGRGDEHNPPALDAQVAPVPGIATAIHNPPLGQHQIKIAHWRPKPSFLAGTPFGASVAQGCRKATALSPKRSSR